MSYREKVFFVNGEVSMALPNLRWQFPLTLLAISQATWFEEAKLLLAACCSPRTNPANQKAVHNTWTSRHLDISKKKKKTQWYRINLTMCKSRRIEWCTWISVNSCGYVSIQFHIAFSNDAISTRWTDFLNNLLFDIVSVVIDSLINYDSFLSYLIIPFSNLMSRIVSTLMCWISSMSLKSGFSSLDELNSCSLERTWDMDILVIEIVITKIQNMLPWWYSTKDSIEVI